MDLWQLNVFCKVVETKSFSTAGKRVHLTQPTVSSHIKDLEAHFGCRLIDRLAKEALPTPEGRLLYGYACRLIALKQEAESALSEYQKKIQGRLVVGGSTIPGGYLLPKVLGKFYHDFPEVMVALVVGDTEKIVEGILSGRLEIGLVGARVSDKRMVQEPLVKDKMRLIVSCNHRWAGRSSIAPKMLADAPYITREAGSGTLKSIKKSLAGQGFGVEDLDVVAEMGSTEAVIQGIKNGLGMSILSTIAVAEDLDAGTLHSLEINGLNFDRYLYLTRHRHRSPSPQNRAFTGFLRSQFDQPAASKTPA